MMKIHQNAIARRNPIGQKKSSRTMNRPRDWGGRNSESSDGSTTRIPPRPSPASNRNPKTLHGSHARAVSPVKTEYQRILVKKTIRRPRASARRPRTKLPMNEPMSVAEATRKYRIGLFVGVNPNSAKIAGRTNPMRMISNATNVHANPVRMTSLRWKDVKPPCRRTSSTVRVPASTRLRTPRAYLRIRGLSNLPVTKPGFTGLGARGDWELKRRGVLRISPRELFDVRPVVRHTVRDDLSERLSQTIVVEAAGRDEIVVPVQASLQLALVRHANPVAVHAELRVVDGVHDLDLRAVEDVDPSVVHLAHEDLVRAAFEPFLESVDVDHPILLTDELRHELDELELEPVAVGDVLDHPGDVRERLLEHDHVQLDRFEADPERLLDPAEDWRELAFADVSKCRRIERINRDIDTFQACVPEGLRAFREHRPVRRHRDVGKLADRTIDDLFHVQPNERLAACEFHRADPKLAGDAQEPLDLGYGHLVLVGHPRLQNRTEAFVVAIDAAEIASLRDAHADVSDFASEGVDEHEPS